jgi:cellulose synthase (UDP-forming)
MIRRLLRLLRFAIIATGVLLVDIILLTYFNTLVWPYFWPNSALLVLGIGFAILLWFPELGHSVWMLRIVGILLIFIGQSYFVHSLQITLQYPSLLAVIHLLGFFGTFVILVLNYVNQIKPKDNRTPPPLPTHLPYVAAVVPTYGEPYDILEKTLVSLKKLDYPPDLLCIVISDDGQRPEVLQMAKQHGVYYNPGPQKNAKAGNLNSALRFLESVCPQASLILTQDADEVIHSSFLKKTVGYFDDPSIAFVQTPKEVIAPKSDPFGTRDRMFYDTLQVGRNGYGASFACGSGVVWRINAVKSIGGFSTWNLVEDLTTSYRLHSAGYCSEYHNEKLSVGLAPDDIPGLLKQRGTWAVDTWRLFLFDNPLFKRGLELGQRLQYLELGFFYVMTAFFMPLLMFVPLFALLTGQFIPISGLALFPWLTISVLYYVVLSGGRTRDMLRMWQYWIGLWPTYFGAFWIALFSYRKKPQYKVTRKTRVGGFYGHLLWVQFLFMFASAFAILRGLFLMPEVDLGTRLANIAILVFFMLMMSAICRAAFWGISLHPTRTLAPPPAHRQGRTRTTANERR